MSRPRQEVLEEEWLIVRHSGEIPEIALHSALYYLTDDPDGPRLQLSGEERESLQEAAATRYHEIIMRDLCFENRELSIYRGVRRAICNWHRFVAFCKRQDCACNHLHRPGMAQYRSLQGRMKSDRVATAEAFLTLLKTALHVTGNAAPAIPGSRGIRPSLVVAAPAIPGSRGIRPSLVVAAPAPVFNCTFHDIILFARELRITEEQLPQHIHLFCHEQNTHQNNPISTI
jgi:hypothetical protein